MAERGHWLKTAFHDGLRQLDVKASIAAAVEHLGVEGSWEQGVVSPSLVGTQCRLARLKRFLGDTAQPGVDGMAMRAGASDTATAINFLRGFWYEAIVVPALRASLGDTRVVGCAPTLLFRYVYGRGTGFHMPPADDPLLSMWTDGHGNTTGITFAGHPDVLVQEPGTDELALVQIKCPSIHKLERVQRMGDGDALESYRAQMATELYIGRRMGWPLSRSYLFLGSLEAIASKDRHPHVHVVTLQWEPAMTTIAEEVAREIVKDYDRAYTTGEWPAPYPRAAWDAFPCSYCQYSRLGTLDTIACDEADQWERFAATGETRLTALPPTADNVIPLRKARRRRTA